MTEIILNDECMHCNDKECHDGEHFCNEAMKDNSFYKNARLYKGLEVIQRPTYKDLEKENAELKKNYEDSLVACGLLKQKVELLSQPSPLESMQDVLITTQKAQNEKQREQLTKAKELLAKWVELYKPKLEGYPITPIQEQTEQFLNSEVEK